MHTYSPGGLSGQYSHLHIRELLEIKISCVGTAGWSRYHLKSTVGCSVQNFFLLILKIDQCQVKDHDFWILEW